MQNEINRDSSVISTSRWIIWILTVSVIFSTILADKTLAAPAVPSSPSSFDCKVQPYYKHRKDGKPGREVTLLFKGSKLYGSATIRVEYNSKTEESVVN